MIKIIVDKRETKLYQCMTDFIATNSIANIELEDAVLELGDIHFTDSATGELLLIIERKTFADLLASLKDGRYSEQSYRLIGSGIIPNSCRMRVIYLIEGIFSQLSREQDRRTIISCLTSLNQFKGFSTMKTATTQESAWHLIYMAQKIERELKDGKPMYLPDTTPSSGQVECQGQGQGQVSAKDYCEVVKKTKKDNITKENIGEIFLCQIPGISAQSATAILKPFSESGGFLAFLDEIRTNPGYLDTIYIENEQGKRRKLGSNVIRACKEYLT